MAEEDLVDGRTASLLGAVSCPVLWDLVSLAGPTPKRDPTKQRGPAGSCVVVPLASSRTTADAAVV